jgi:hypothetical protein
MFEDVKTLKKEAYLSVILFFSMCLFLAVLYYWHQKDLDVWNTSKNAEVLVTAKHQGSGKEDPRLVYVKDGATIVGVKTSARWYFETKIGQKTVVRYSPVHNAYRQPYHVAGKEIYLFWYCIFPALIFLGRGIWLFRKIRTLTHQPR